MICNILCVGTELLLGQIDDTNSSHIGRLLADHGIDSFEHRHVGDNRDRIKHAMQTMIDTCDILIVTGGLGPTHDDITRDVVAELMGVTLHSDERVAQHIEEIFAGRQQQMPQNNMRQAMVPEGATVLLNELGTAPGLKCSIEVRGHQKIIYLVPGVPYEMDFLMSRYIIPELQELLGDKVIVTRTIKTWGIPESMLAQMLDTYVQRGETDMVKVGFLARGMKGINVKLSTSAATRNEALNNILPVEREVVALLGDIVYAYDEDSMESVIVEELIKHSLTIAVAESLTGGMVSSQIVNVPGSSNVLKGSIVSYTKDIKHNVLGVSAIDVYSHECARQMAHGVRELFGADIGCSTTGVAGPGSSDGHNPGELYVGLSCSSGDESYGFHLGGDRQRIREYSSMTTLDIVRKYLRSL